MLVECMLPCTFIDGIPGASGVVGPAYGSEQVIDDRQPLVRGQPAGVQGIALSDAASEGFIQNIPSPSEGEFQHILVVRSHPSIILGDKDRPRHFCTTGP